MWQPSSHENQTRGEQPQCSGDAKKPPRNKPGLRLRGVVLKRWVNRDGVRDRTYRGFIWTCARFDSDTSSLMAVGSDRRERSDNNHSCGAMFVKRLLDGPASVTTGMIDRIWLWNPQWVLYKCDSAHPLQKCDFSAWGLDQSGDWRPFSSVTLYPKYPDEFAEYWLRLWPPAGDSSGAVTASTYLLGLILPELAQLGEPMLPMVGRL